MNSDATENQLFDRAVTLIADRSFTAVANLLGGPENFEAKVREWIGAGRFAGKAELLEEVLERACFHGRTSLADFLLDAGVDPGNGKRSGQTGFHYAAMNGHLDTVKSLIARGAPLEIENMYGGTVLGQALWSAVNEPHESHAAIIEQLVTAGAVIEPGTREWWSNQNISSIEIKERVALALNRAKWTAQSRQDV